MIHVQSAFSEDCKGVITNISIKNEIKYINEDVRNICIFELSNGNSDYSGKLIKADHIDYRIISDKSLCNKLDLSENKNAAILYIYNVGEFSDEFRKFVSEDDIDTYDNEITKYNIKGNIITSTALGRDGADIHVCVFKILEGRPILIHASSLGNIKVFSKQK